MSPRIAIAATRLADFRERDWRIGDAVAEFYRRTVSANQRGDFRAK
jgi:hypothetical protein